MVMRGLSADVKQVIRALAARFRRSDRAPTAEYCGGVATRLDLRGGSSELPQIAGELASCARIVELANVGREDERAFDAMYAQAKLLLRRSADQLGASAWRPTVPTV